MITLQKVKKHEEPVLHSLMQFYIYEFSKYIKEIRLEGTGSYKPFNLDNYWVEPDYHPFFIKLDDEFIGFALIESESVVKSNTIHEFFVIQKYNGKGFGKIAAKQLFSIFPGKWTITQIHNNYPAQAFWRSVISEFTGGKYSERYDDNRKSVQEFDTKAIEALKRCEHVEPV